MGRIETHYLPYSWEIDKPVQYKDWIELADVDESYPYEVDQTKIYKAGNEYALAVAAGCSCWDGDWTVQFFDTLDEIEKHLFEEDFRWNPSFEGAKELIKQAREKDAEKG